MARIYQSWLPELEGIDRVKVGKRVAKYSLSKHEAAAPGFKNQFWQVYWEDGRKWRMRFGEQTSSIQTASGKSLNMPTRVTPEMIRIRHPEADTIYEMVFSEGILFCEKYQGESRRDLKLGLGMPLR